MQFASARIITDDVTALTDFYEQVLDAPASRPAPVFAEITTRTATLAIGHVDTMNLFSAGAAIPRANHTVILEFLVDDVDAEYRRLATLSIAPDVVQEPTTMPWGNRSLLIRDPDGNLVNLFAPVSDDARARAEAYSSV
ncbi:VOC family protein [Gordonia sp. TBRC 11910]|uniref:VOC family protein n=1 Tax=Gordonia asplenii TaxID=2725283 RepID=A0A848KVK2_9ACTN|nr:VOC family protein [Gordonia asplenii]NMO02077.1 VOC family protein [Gordonia asplenii]